MYKAIKLAGALLLGGPLAVHQGAPVIDGFVVQVSSLISGLAVSQGSWKEGKGDRYVTGSLPQYGSAILVQGGKSTTIVLMGDREP